MRNKHIDSRKGVKEARVGSAWRRYIISRMCLKIIDGLGEISSQNSF